ncbi:MAG: protein kinase domain-containing protein, partial [Aureliella sp.]
MDDELELAAAFDEFLRSSSSAASSAGSAAPAAGDFDPAQSRPAKADVIRLLHEVFRSPASGPAATPDASADPAAAVNADSALETPQSIGRFKIERLLGSGAFGSVYLAHDPVLGRLVALKVIHRHLLNDQSVRRRVLREREVMARLQHPNVVPVWDAGE